MARIRLNDKSTQRAVPAVGQVELWDDLLPGFGLRLSAGGSRTWFVMRRVDGRLLRRTVGKAPPRETPKDAKLEPPLFWLKDARVEARRLLTDMQVGRDPKQATAPAASGDDRFKVVAERYLANTLRGGGAGLRTKDELARKLKVDLKAWHARPISEIRRRDIQALVDEKAEVSPIAANRLLSFIKRVFRWAVSKDIIDADPAVAVGKPADENERDRYLSDEEIRLFWRACDDLGDPAGRLFKLALVTGQRRGEVAGLRRSELGKLDYRTQRAGKEVTVTGEAWLLSADRTKRGTAHTVPLSPLAKKLIDGAPKLRIGGKTFDCVLASGARGDQPVTGWSRFKERLDELIGRQIAKELGEDFDAAKHKIAVWHIHDLRATVATLMEHRLGVSRTVISRVLNHAEGDGGKSMTGRYIRHTWDAEAADALNRWADELSRIVGLNVVNLRKGRARD
jgi:integrase